MPTKARRVVWTEPSVVAMQDVTLNDPGPQEVLVQADRTLISPGTERAFLMNLDNTSGQYPRSGGYCFVGHVEQVGSGVSSLKVGDRIACAASHMSHAVVRAERCVPVPESVSSEAAAFFNLAVIALQGVRKAKIELGEAVVVFGGGLIGLLAAKLARLHGGVPVVTVDLHELRRKLAVECAADIALDPRAPDFKEALASIVSGANANRGDAPQVVIEATGFPEVILSAMDVAGWMARVVLLGSSRGVTPQVNFYADVHKKGLTLLGAHAGTVPQTESSHGLWTWTANARTALRLMEHGRLDVSPLITHRVPSEDAPKIYGEITQWNPNVLGAILEWK